MDNRRRVLSYLSSSIVTTGLPSLPFSTSAESAPNGLQYAVLDPQTGKILIQDRANTQRAPASLTKMMSALVIFEAMQNPDTKFNLSTQITIPKLTRELIPPGSGIAVFTEMKPGQKVPVEKLLIGMGGRSDAYSTLALAVHLGHQDVYNWGGSDYDKLHIFIDHMNQKANDLRMSNTHFSVTTGLPRDNNYSTPNDLVALMHHINTHHAQRAEITFGQLRFNLNPISSSKEHTSRLLKQRPDRVRWAKTGWTNAAGYCLAVLYEKDDIPLIGIVLGAKGRTDRNRTMLSILTDAYKERENHSVLIPQRRPAPLIKPPPPKPRITI